MAHPVEKKINSARVHEITGRSGLNRIVLLFHGIKLSCDLKKSQLLQ